jgi:xylulokinase
MQECKPVPYVIGVDIGTTAIKVGAFDLSELHLKSLASKQMGDSLSIPSEELWRQTKDAIREAISAFGNRTEIVAIGVAGQMHGAVLYDASGKVIDPIFTWRNQENCSEKILEDVQRIVADGNYRELGTEMACGYTGEILLWLRENDPGLFRKIRKFGLITDFIRSKLLEKGDFCTDPTNAFGTGLFNVRDNSWHFDLIRALKFDIDIFPDVHRSPEIAGFVFTPLARELGLGEIPVIYGGGDNQIGMIGSGLISPESPILINIGTAAQISKVIAK